jgi:archaellum component FlaC
MDTDTEQNKRIRSVEDRINMIENDLAAISAKLEVIQSLSRGVLIVAGLALGIDIVPMM